MALKQGTLIDKRYEVREELGRGGMGAVYRVRHKDLHTDYALKELLDGAPDALQQFAAEARILAGLDHANLPRVNNFFSFQGKNYLVMEYVPGDDLEAVLAARVGPLTQAEVVSWAVQVLDALAYIHGRGVIHRDIKPANIKLTPQGKIKLVDFGIAKAGRAGMLTGCVAKGAYTPYLAAPEQVQGLPTDHRSDLYALGMTMAYLLTGILPAPPDLAPRNPTVTQDVQRVIQRATAHAPSQRWQSAAEMQAALAATARPATAPFAPGPALPTFRREIRRF